MTGKVSSLSRSLNYAIISPTDGDANIYIHAEEFGQYWKELALGTSVRFSSLQGASGLKGYNVTVLTDTSTPGTVSLFETNNGSRETASRHYTNTNESNETKKFDCDGLIASALISIVPDISAEQVNAVCTYLAEYLGLAYANASASLQSRV